MEAYLDGYREDFPEDEEESNPLVTVGIVVGLIVVAAIICAILWGVTHRDKQNTPSDIPGMENTDLPVGADGIGNTDGISGTGENGLENTGVLLVMKRIPWMVRRMRMGKSPRTVKMGRNL